METELTTKQFIEAKQRLASENGRKGALARWSKEGNELERKKLGERLTAGRKNKNYIWLRDKKRKDTLQNSK